MVNKKFNLKEAPPVYRKTRSPLKSTGSTFSPPKIKRIPKEIEPMPRLRMNKPLEEDICIHLFSVSAAMVGVCLTVIGLIRVDQLPLWIYNPNLLNR